MPGSKHTVTPSDRFLHREQDTPDAVGDALNDTHTVQHCLETATTLFHQALPDTTREHITEKWGINNDMINTRRIGYADSTNDIITELLDTGYNPLTIVRAGLGTSPLINHVFQCTGVTPDHAHLVNTDEYPNAIADSDCTHTVPEPIDELSAALATGHITPEQIDLRAVADYITDDTDEHLFVRNWWDERITFPYFNDTGDVCYLIARATDDTNDIVYSNGITDLTTDYIRTVADTALAQHIPVEPVVLEDYITTPLFEPVYNAPDDNKYRDAAQTVAPTLTETATTDTANDTSLSDIGVTREPGIAEQHRDTGTARVTIRHGTTGVLPGDGTPTRPVLTPVAPGVTPGTHIEFKNQLNTPVTVEIIGTPGGAWWETTTIDPGTHETLHCSHAGMYKYRVTAPGDSIEDMHGMTIAYNDVYTDTRTDRVEHWVSDEPNFDVDIAKYVKQTIARPWINRDAVHEPIFGRETVHEGKSLLVTEGVTDAIAAHQHGFPCIAPATTNFKQHHYDRICEHAANVKNVYVVNDNEVNNAGVNGALRTAKIIENAGHNAVVCELPRPPDQDKIDVAEFLKHASKQEFLDVLNAGVPPTDHDMYDPARHNPDHNHRTGTGEDGDGTERSNAAARNADQHAPGVPDDVLQSDSTSALYALDLRDVIDFNALDTTGSGGTLYRGVNPIQHHGNSTGYFVIRDHDEFVTAKDFKIESNGDGYYYNALTWLACTAACDCSITTQCSCTRSVTRPMGSLSNSEVFWAWKHAKETEHIPVPADDPVPLKAVWWLAAHHELIPDEYIPDSYDDELSLPPSAYNNVLRVIREEYAVDPGREPRSQ